MSGVSLPVTRPIGRALVVANPSSRGPLVSTLTKMGLDCYECDDPYTATLELCRHRLEYRTCILSLASLYREELTLIATVKRRFPHMEIWLSHTDGRLAALAESMRLGADGLLDEEGFHRIAGPAQIETAAYQPPSAQQFTPMPLDIPEPETIEETPTDPNLAIGEPVLTAEELRALLQDQSPMPPSGAGEDES